MKDKPKSNPVLLSVVIILIDNAYNNDKKLFVKQKDRFVTEKKDNRWGYVSVDASMLSERNEKVQLVSEY